MLDGLDVDLLSRLWPVVCAAPFMGHRAAAVIAGCIAVAAATEDGIECLAVGAPLHQCDFGFALAGIGVNLGAVVGVLVLVEVDID